jgi:colanic acid biosynthesis glycosyl transferase WcaI
LTLVLADFAGHDFTFQMAQDLRQSGLDVRYQFCMSNEAPRGRQESGVDERSTWVEPLSLGRQFSKYSAGRRLVDEAKYGWRARRNVHRGDVVVMANMPVVSGIVIAAWSRWKGARPVLWLQDVQWGLARASGAKTPVWAGLYVLELLLLWLTERTIAISESFARRARSGTLGRRRVVVLENWATLEDPPRARAVTQTARTSGSRFRFQYSGTLAKKHSSDLLVDLAREFERDEHVEVLVTAGGAGCDELRAASEREGLGLVVEGLRPAEEVMATLGEADVLVAVLTADAGKFSVPSKVLKYLVAGRPVLFAGPIDNLAAQTVKAASAGLVVVPEAVELRAAARSMTSDRARLAEMGRNGRRWAEEHFRTDVIAPRFLAAAGIERP